MISVAMAYYNGGEYIREQVESILPQLGPEDELIISVDAAEDGSLDLLKEMSREDDRIRLGPLFKDLMIDLHEFSACDRFFFDKEFSDLIKRISVLGKLPLRFFVSVLEHLHDLMVDLRCR